MENLKNYLFELCSEYAPSGREELISSIERIVRPFADKCYRDSVGNLVAVKYSKIPGAQKIMLDAHIDEIGLVVTGVDDMGFVHFANHAGIDPRILPGSTVTVISKLPLTGVVATKPPHLLKDEDSSKLMKAKDLVIDIGFSAEKARSLVKVGDFIALRSGCADLKNELVMGKAFDNRACVSVLCCLLLMLSKTRTDYDVYVVFSAGEEFGGYGAKTAAFEIAPDKAIVLDATFGISPYTSAPKGKELGGGPAILVCPLLDNHLTDALTDLAKSKSIPYQIEVTGGRTGTNADGIVVTRSGVPTAVLSVPLRYMHSAGEIVSLKDMKNTLKLVLAFLERGDKA